MKFLEKLFKRQKEGPPKTIAAKPQHNIKLSLNGGESEDDIRTHAGAQWQEVNGAELREAESQAEILSEEIAKIKDKRQKAEKELAATDHTVPMNRRGERAAAQDEGGSPHIDDTPFKEWGDIDKIKATLFWGVALLLMFAAAANVYSVLMASGQPAFLDAPWTAILLSMLAPAFSVAFKSVYELFNLDQARWLYAFGMFVLNGMIVLVWAILFAFTYEGVSAGIDFDNLGNESGHGLLATFLTITQIGGEILTGASLMLAFERLSAKYSGLYHVKNVQFLEREAVCKALAEELGEITAAHIAAEGRRDQLLASRTVFIAEALLNARAVRKSTEN